MSFERIFNKNHLREFVTIKTAKWDAKLKKAVAVSKKVCPPGKTGPDCKKVLTADQKAKMRKTLSKMLSKMSAIKIQKRAAHAATTRAFIKSKNLKSVAQFKKAD